MAGGSPVGKFMTYYDDAARFDESEIDLALTIARQLGFSVERMTGRRSASRKRAAAADGAQRRSDGGLGMGYRVGQGNLVAEVLEELHGLQPGTFGGTLDDFRNATYIPTMSRWPKRGSARRWKRARTIIRSTASEAGRDAALAGKLWQVRSRPREGSPQLAGVCMDISERKQAEAQRDLLVAELSHRVKNTLATVISIARQSFATNPDAVEAQRSFNARIRALGQTHSRLAEANWSGVSLETVLLDELAPYRREDGANVRASGPVTDAERQAGADAWHGHP